MELDQNSSDKQQEASAQSAEESQLFRNHSSVKRKYEDGGDDDLVHKRPRNASAQLSSLFEKPLQVQSASQPHVSQNVISLYGLDQTAHGVARRNEDTGAKINKLRKSYGNKIKDLPGNNEALKRSDDLLGILQMPGDVFQNAVVAGKDLHHGLPENVFAKLDKAVQLAPGRLPLDDDVAWRKYLAIDENNRQLASTSQPSPLSRQPREQRAESLSATNPRLMRRGTKRRYDDDSFEGYGEGFGDDSDVPLATGLEDEELANKKRGRSRKESALPGTINQFASNTVSVGPGSYGSR